MMSEAALRPRRVRMMSPELDARSRSLVILNCDQGGEAGFIKLSREDEFYVIRKRRRLEGGECFIRRVEVSRVAEVRD